VYRDKINDDRRQGDNRDLVRCDSQVADEKSPPLPFAQTVQTPMAITDKDILGNHLRNTAAPNTNGDVLTNDFLRFNK
jgi:hypothetical protein